MTSCLYECLREVGLQRHYPSFTAMGLRRAAHLVVLNMEDYPSVGVHTMEDRTRLFHLVQLVKTLELDGQAEAGTDDEDDEEERTVRATENSTPLVGLGSARRKLNFTVDDDNDDDDEKFANYNAAVGGQYENSDHDEDDGGRRNNELQSTTPLFRRCIHSTRRHLALDDDDQDDNDGYDDDDGYLLDCHTSRAATAADTSGIQTGTRHTAGDHGNLRLNTRGNAGICRQLDFGDEPIKLAQGCPRTNSQLNSGICIFQHTSGVVNKPKSGSIKISPVKITSKPGRAVTPKANQIGSTAAASSNRGRLTANNPMGVYRKSKRAERVKGAYGTCSRRSPPKVVFESRRTPGYNYGLPLSSPMTKINILRGQRIRVCVRKRPLTSAEDRRGETDVVTTQDRVCVIIHEGKEAVDLMQYTLQHKFCFTQVFGEGSSNEEVYLETAFPLVQHVLNGGKATCFAYGQTGAGKTHTMLGSSSGQPGLYALAARDIFAYLDSTPLHPCNGTHTPLPVQVYVSFFEIYCGQLYDLLDHRKRLFAREDGHRVVQIAGLTEVKVGSVSALLEVISLGTGIRTQGVSGVNPSSSRSHALLQIQLRGSPQCLAGRMWFVDLAGSERASDTRGSDRVSRMEAAEINQSLLALKECIRSLDQEQTHTPFRQSKLTQVLKDSFVGNSKTCMIANISPGCLATEHTLNTLRYADRVKELSGGRGRRNTGTPSSKHRQTTTTSTSARGDRSPAKRRQLRGHREEGCGPGADTTTTTSVSPNTKPNKSTSNKPTVRPNTTNRNTTSIPNFIGGALFCSTPKSQGPEEEEGWMRRGRRRGRKERVNQDDSSPDPGSLGQQKRERAGAREGQEERRDGKKEREERGERNEVASRPMRIQRHHAGAGCVVSRPMRTQTDDEEEARVGSQPIRTQTGDLGVGLVVKQPLRDRSHSLGTSREGGANGGQTSAVQRSPPVERRSDTRDGERGGGVWRDEERKEEKILNDRKRRVDDGQRDRNGEIQQNGQIHQRDGKRDEGTRKEREMHLRRYHQQLQQFQPSHTTLSLSPSLSPLSQSLSPSLSPSLPPSLSPSLLSSLSPSTSPSVSTPLSPSLSPSGPPSLSPSSSNAPLASPSAHPPLSASPSIHPSLPPSISRGLTALLSVYKATTRVRDNSLHEERPQNVHTHQEDDEDEEEEEEEEEDAVDGRVIDGWYLTSRVEQEEERETTEREEERERRDGRRSSDRAGSGRENELEQRGGRLAWQSSRESEEQGTIPAAIFGIGRERGAILSDGRGRRFALENGGHEEEGGDFLIAEEWSTEDEQDDEQQKEEEEEEGEEEEDEEEDSYALGSTDSTNDNNCLYQPHLSQRAPAERPLSPQGDPPSPVKLNNLSLESKDINHTSNHKLLCMDLQNVSVVPQRAPLHLGQRPQTLGGAGLANQTRPFHLCRSNSETNSDHRPKGGLSGHKDLPSALTTDHSTTILRCKQSFSLAPMPTAAHPKQTGSDGSTEQTHSTTPISTAPSSPTLTQLHPNVLRVFQGPSNSSIEPTAAPPHRSSPKAEPGPLSRTHSTPGPPPSSSPSGDSSSCSVEPLSLSLLQVDLLAATQSFLCGEPRVSSSKLGEETMGESVGMGREDKGKRDAIGREEERGVEKTGGKRGEDEEGDAEMRFVDLLAMKAGCHGASPKTGRMTVGRGEEKNVAMDTGRWKIGMSQPTVPVVALMTLQSQAAFLKLPPQPGSNVLGYKDQAYPLEHPLHISASHGAIKSDTVHPNAFAHKLYTLPHIITQLETPKLSLQNTRNPLVPNALPTSNLDQPMPLKQSHVANSHKPCPATGIEFEELHYPEDSGRSGCHTLSLHEDLEFEQWRIVQAHWDELEEMETLCRSEATLLCQQPDMVFKEYVKKVDEIMAKKARCVDSVRVQLQPYLNP